jgi:hypothetical protein
MIQANTTHFPYNVVNLILEHAQLLDEDLFVTNRPLRESDPNQSIGVFGMQWMPDEETFEMRGLPAGISEPTISRYVISLQACIKDMDEARGAEVHATLAKMIRTMLYRDEALRVALRQLSVTMSESVERTQRFGVQTQRYLSNELEGAWLYLSTLEFWLETETT